MESDDFASVLIIDVKQEDVSEAQGKYRMFSKNSQSPWCNQDIKQAKLEYCLTCENYGECNVHYRYTESVPLFCKKRSSQYSTTSLFKLTRQSNCLPHDKNYAGYCRLSESAPLLHVET